MNVNRVTAPPRPGYKAYAMHRYAVHRFHPSSCCGCCMYSCGHFLAGAGSKSHVYGPPTTLNYLKRYQVDYRRGGACQGATLAKMGDVVFRAFRTNGRHPATGSTPKRQRNLAYFLCTMMLAMRFQTNPRAVGVVVTPQCKRIHSV
jgi:hypothetical protein